MENNVVLFDGVCNLCHSTVQKLIELDKNNLLKFASLQSDYGQKILIENKIENHHFDSFIYYRNGKIFTKSDAALEVLSDLGKMGARPLLLIPKFLRNGIYDFIAKNRFKWFGKQESCWLPTPELKEKFLI